MPREETSQEVSTIIQTIKELTRKSGMRGDRLKNIRELNAAIGVLHNEIIDGLRNVPDPNFYKGQLGEINVALKELTDQLGKSETDNDELIKQILLNANQLIEIRENMPNYNRSAPPPSVINARQKISAIDSRGASAPPPPPPAQNVRGTGFGLQGSRPVNLAYSDGPRNPFGGYKHSKTNSRKYMVKKFRSARNSIKRKKRRRSKTLRRKI